MSPRPGGVRPGAGSSLDPVAAFEAAIGRELSGISGRELKEPAALLSARYRSSGGIETGGGFATREAHAYLAARLPATLAAVRRVLADLARARPDWEPRSVLDIGAGPGTATWAAVSQFPSIERAVLLDRDREMTALGSRLAEESGTGVLAGASWNVGDATEATHRASDLVVAAYVLGELGHGREGVAVQLWWGAALDELVLIEPGTPAGFERLRAARTALIASGAHVAAPCPHDDRCPMEGLDWCHFAVRLSRSALHRDLKAARLGYEDEKYSYLAVSRERPSRRPPRLVRSPRLHKGHVRLWLCEENGLHERVVSRRDGDRYKRARAARWGDCFEESNESNGRADESGFDEE